MFRIETEVTELDGKIAAAILVCGLIATLWGAVSLQQKVCAGDRGNATALNTRVARREKGSQLNPCIPPANWDAYLKQQPRWSETFTNTPYVGIGTDKVVYVRWLDQEKAIPVSQLRALLVSLPVSAWKYGRLVEFHGWSEAPDDKVKQYNEATRQVEKILEELHTETVSLPT